MTDNKELLTEENLSPEAEIAEIEETEEEAAEVEMTDATATLEDDLNTLKAEFPELADIESITELGNPTRYAALRDLGLTAREAYLATSARPLARTDNRAHLTSGVPRAARSPLTSMTKSQLAEARELFKGMSDAQIHQLYKKVTN